MAETRMSIDALAREFLAQKRIAVAGVSRDPKQAANLIFRKLRDTGHVVFAVNPRAQEVEGVACYDTLAAIPEPVDAVVIATPPAAADAVVDECAALGITRVWMHRSFGAGSVSPTAVAKCREHGIRVIAGACPMMFLEPVDPGHKCIRWFLRVTHRMPSALLLVLLLAMLASAANAKEPRVKGDRLDFRMCTVAGDTVTSADARFQRKVVFVTLWATWCPPCISEMPTFNDLQTRYADDGLVIVAIAFERSDDPNARRGHLSAFATEHGINYLVLDGGSVSDFSQALPMMDDVKGLPIEILIDRTGRVVACRNGYGYKKRWAQKLEKELKDLLSAHPARSE